MIRCDCTPLYRTYVVLIVSINELMDGTFCASLKGCWCNHRNAVLLISQSQLVSVIIWHRNWCRNILLRSQQFWRGYTISHRMGLPIYLNVKFKCYLGDPYTRSKCMKTSKWSNFMGVANEKFFGTHTQLIMISKIDILESLEEATYSLGTDFVPSFNWFPIRINSFLAIYFIVRTWNPLLPLPESMLAMVIPDVSSLLAPCSHRQSTVILLLRSSWSTTSSTAHRICITHK